MKIPAAIKRLIAGAASAQKAAYCPYSRYAVGAAVLTRSGRIFSGCNVENASYGLTICAERAAVANAVVHGQNDFTAIAIVSRSPKSCGACRQVMFEFSNKSTQVYLVDQHPDTGRQTVRRTTVYKLLPHAFDPLASGLLPANPKNLLRKMR